MNAPREDELLRLRRELAETEATIAALRRENAALGGDPPPGPPLIPGG